MKLFYAPGACSLAVHIALCEAELQFDLEKVDLKTKKTASGEDFCALNPKGAVPALLLDDGQLLTEGIAILQFVADQVPDKQLSPACGTFERTRLTEWLSYVVSDIHKAFSPLFDPATPSESKAAIRAKIAKRLGYANQAVTTRDYLMGATFTVADAYLFVMLSWCAPSGIGLTGLPALAAFQKRVAARPAVRIAKIAEGLQQA